MGDQDGGATGPGDPGNWDLELDLGPAAKPEPAPEPRPLAQPSKPATGSAGPSLGTGGLDDEAPDMAIALADDLDPGGSLGPAGARPRLAVSSHGGPDRRSSEPGSGRALRVRAHADAPTGAAWVILSVLLSLLLTAAVPYLLPDGIAFVEKALAPYGYVPFVVFGAAVFAAWAFATSRGFREASWGLYLTSFALLVVLIGVGLITASVVSGSLTSMAFRKLMPFAIPLATAAAICGLAAAGVRKFREEAFEEQRVAYGVVVLLVSLAGFALGVRVARIDLPIPRLDAPTMPVIWTNPF